jgi:hypothetical protein
MMFCAIWMRRNRVEASRHEAEDVLQGGAGAIHILPPYRTYIFPSYRDFSASSDVWFNS